MPKMMPNLPEEIIEDILARLTAKEVLRCHCLSHTWAATLSSEAFMKRHLVLANRHGAPKIVISLGPRLFIQVLVWSIQNPDGTPAITYRRIGCARAMTSPCHGLILLHTHENMFYICNPSIQEIKGLPPFIDKHTDGTFGLGYDQLTKEYKVVRLCLNRWTKDFAGCEIFTINSTGQWRPVPDDRMPPVSNVLWSNQGIFAQGHVHWIVATRDVDHDDMDSISRFIVSFSLSDETFRLLQPPDSLDTKHNFEMTEVNGCLCLFSIATNCKGNRTYDLWMLRDYDAGMWELLCQIDATCSIPEIDIKVDLFEWCCTHSAPEFDLYECCATIRPLAFMEDRILFLFYRRGFVPNGIKSMLVTYSSFNNQLSAYYPVESTALGNFSTDDVRQVWLYEESLVRLV